MARSKRQPTPGDMIRSLAVILLPILVITVIATRNLDDHPVEAIDWLPVLAQARSEAPYEVLAPVNLPADWTPTRASWTKTGAPLPTGQPAVRHTWQLGFLSPDKIYIALNQGDLTSDEFVNDVTRQGLADGQSTVGEITWERRVSTDDRTRSLVWVNDKVTTVIVGDTGYEGLEAYAGTLTGPTK